MIEAICISFFFGCIIGSCATIILILLLIVTRPDTLRKALEELTEMKEWMKAKKRR